MLELLYLIFIQPIELGMGFILEITYSLTGSYGLSIIILSLAVSLTVTPFYYLAEKWRNSERQITDKMAPKVKEIKLAFKGEERLMILSTLYRQNHYHPIMAARTSLGLLIQIPFFFAAFHLLGSYEALKGVKFLFFGDLAQPDQALKIAGFGINVMPFAMTALNLSSAIIYGQNLPRNERIQLYLISGVFLVLLYDSPVALVFYWTLNNCFYLMKNIVDKKFLWPGKTTLAESAEDKKISGKPGILKKILLKFFKNYGSCAEKYFPSLWLARFLVFSFLCAFGAHLYLTSIGSYSDAALKTTLFLISLATLIFISFTTLGKFAQNLKWNKFNLLLLGIISYFLVRAVFSGDSYLSNAYKARKSIQENEILLFLMVAVAVSLISPALAWVKKHEKNLDLKICLASGVLVSSLLFIHIPLALLSSDISILQNSSGPWFFVQIFLCFSISLLVLYGLHKAMPEGNRGIFTFVMVCLGAIGLLYTYAFTGNYGIIDDAWEVEYSKNLYTHLYPSYDVAIILSTIGLLLLALTYGGRALLFSSLIVVNTSLVIVTFISSGNIDFSGKTAGAKATAALPSYNRDLMSFSKDGQNVMVFMLDMFSGKNMGKLINRHPEFKSIFDGFVWYPNTLSAGNSTLLGEPGIHGGHRFTPLEINRREVLSLEDEIARGFSVFSDSFGQKGFDVSFAGLDITLTRCDRIKKYVKFPLKYCGDEMSNNWDYSEYWFGNNKETNNWLKANNSLYLSALLPSIGIFKASPFSLRRIIYAKGSWLGAYNGKVQDAVTALGRFAFIDSLASISNADSKNDTFKYIQTKATHSPYVLDESCKINTGKKWSKSVGYHSHTACIMKSFEKWFLWLKKNNLYDNTKIIMVSDHGLHSDSPNNKPRADALMLIKDFNKTGALKADETFLSNADTPAIACEVIGGCENIIPDPTKYPIKNRTLFYSAGPLARVSHWKNKFIIREQYAVQSPPFDFENWTRIK